MLHVFLPVLASHLFICIGFRAFYLYWLSGADANWLPASPTTDASSGTLRFNMVRILGEGVKEGMMIQTTLWGHWTKKFKRWQPGKEALDFVERSEPTQSFKVSQGNGNLRLVVGVLVHLHLNCSKISWYISAGSVASTDVENSKKATTSGRSLWSSWAWGRSGCAWIDKALPTLNTCIFVFWETTRIGSHLHHIR